MNAQSALPAITLWKNDKQKKNKKNQLGKIHAHAVHQSGLADLPIDLKNSQQVEESTQDVDFEAHVPHLRDPRYSAKETQDCSLKTKEVDEAEWLTSREAARFLKVSEGTLRNMTSNGRIPYSKLGRSNRYSRKELNALILSNRRGSNGN